MASIRTHYLDTSAMVKLFVDEPGSEGLRSYLGPHATRVTTSLCLAETLGVLKSKVTHNHLSQDEYLRACADLMGCVRCGSLEVEDIGLAERPVFDQVDQLCERHGLDVSDAFQLLTLRSGQLSRLEGESRPILVTADKRLAAAARDEGLRAWDCIHEPAP